MNIVLLEGSPNKKGSSNLLAEQFLRGAKESGHVVSVADIAHAKLHPCIGCYHCEREGVCCFQDDLEKIKEQILCADMIAFVTPLYYFGMSSQIKVLIDRFTSFNDLIQEKHLKSVLISVAAGTEEWIFEALEAHYKAIGHYLNLEDQGILLGYGCGTVDMTRQSEYMNQAYELGKKI